jgi:hypothetical protein
MKDEGGGSDLKACVYPVHPWFSFASAASHRQCGLAPPVWPRTASAASHRQCGLAPCSCRSFR